MDKKKAVVVFSGGQDSTTCLLWALDRYDEVVAVTVKYGQRHDVELQCAAAACRELGVPQIVLDMSFIGEMSRSALTDENSPIGEAHPLRDDLPASFVPNRNAMFLTAAHALAQNIGAEEVITGVCQTDYSGYPDCRQDFITALNATLNLGGAVDVEIVTPLMYLTKAQTFAMATEHGGLGFVVEMSHTCYEGDRSIRHDWGYGCGTCPACELRRKGWEEFQMNMRGKA